MLSKNKVIARFGHMPNTSAEAKSMLITLVSEMDSAELVKVIAGVKSSKNRANPTFLLGMELAEKELQRRA